MESEIRTRAVTALQLAKGDVIRDDQGALHRVTDWESHPDICVAFRTDTGHDIRVPWNDRRGYDALIPRPDDAALARLRTRVWAPATRRP